MKKIITLCMLLVSLLVTTNNMQARQLPAKTTIQARQVPTKRTGRTQARRTATRKLTPPQQAIKQEVTREIRDDSKNLQEDLAKVAQASTPEQKEQAQEDAIKSAEQLLKTLQETRSMLGDITGYSDTQVGMALTKLDLLKSPRDRIVKQIANVQKQLSKVTDKGIFWDTPKEGKEIEFEMLTARRDKLNEILARVDRAISNQKIITGEAWSNAYWLLLAAGATLGVDFAVTGGATTAMAGSALKTAAGSAMGKAGMLGSWLKTKAGAGLDYAWLVANYGLSAASTLWFLYNKYSEANAVYQTALNVYDQVTAEDSGATAEERTEAKENLLNAQKDRDLSRLTAERFKDDLAAGNFTPEQLKLSSEELKKLAESRPKRARAAKK